MSSLFASVPTTSLSTSAAVPRVFYEPACTGATCQSTCPTQLRIDSGYSSDPAWLTPFLKFLTVVFCLLAASATIITAASYVRHRQLLGAIKRATQQAEDQRQSRSQPSDIPDLETTRLSRVSMGLSFEGRFGSQVQLGLRGLPVSAVRRSMQFSHWPGGQNRPET